MRTLLVDARPDGGDFAKGRVKWDVLQCAGARRELARVDLSGCEMLRPYTLACLAALAAWNDGQVELVGPKSKRCAEHLHRMDLHQFFRGDALAGDDHRSTNVPLRRLDAHPGSFASEAMDVWAAEFGSLSVGLQRDLADHLDEIILNALTHANSSIGCIVAGQAFPQAGVLEVAVVDLGQTIRGHLIQNEALTEIPSDDWEAIDYATQAGVTGTPPGTLNRWNEPNSGTGLHMLRQFCEAGHGQLAIVSGEAIQIYPPVMGCAKQRVSAGFAGCLVNVRFFAAQPCSAVADARIVM